MKLEQQVVSLELAKKLKDLGVKQESFFKWREFDDIGLSGRDRGEWVIQQFDKPRSAYVIQSIAAFTVAELGEMLPEEISDEGENDVSWHHLYTYPTGAHWCCSYRFHNGADGTWSTTYVEKARAEADARAKMLIYLIETNLVQNKP